MYYFDNAATTQPFKEVLDTYVRVANEFIGNPSSIHALGRRSHALLEQARLQVSERLNFQPEEIFFTSSGTESNNWVFETIVDALFQASPRNRIIMTQIEHPSVYRLVDRLKDRGFIVEFIQTDPDGRLKVDDLKSRLGDDVLLISTMAVNNEVGTIQPLFEIAEILDDYPQIAWHVDGVQAGLMHHELCHIARIDLLTLSSHKFHSVKGVGILAKRQSIPDGPFLLGGGQERGARSSTENLPAIVATSRALRVVHEQQASAQLRIHGFFEQIKKAMIAHGWIVHTPDVPIASGHILCASLGTVPGEVLVNAFGEHAVYVSTTSACSSRRSQTHATLLAMGVDPATANSAIRISMSFMTTQSEIDVLIQSIQDISSQFLERSAYE